MGAKIAFPLKYDYLASYATARPKPHALLFPYESADQQQSDTYQAGSTHCVNCGHSDITRLYYGEARECDNNGIRELYLLGFVLFYFREPYISTMLY